MHICCWLKSTGERLEGCTAQMSFYETTSSLGRSSSLLPKSVPVFVYTATIPQVPGSGIPKTTARLKCIQQYPSSGWCWASLTFLESGGCLFDAAAKLIFQIWNENIFIYSFYLFLRKGFQTCVQNEAKTEQIPNAWEEPPGCSGLNSLSHLEVRFMGLCGQGSLRGGGGGVPAELEAEGAWWCDRHVVWCVHPGGTYWLY